MIINMSWLTREVTTIRRSDHHPTLQDSHPCHRSYLHTYDGSSKALPPVGDEPPARRLDAAMLRSVCNVDSQGYYSLYAFADGRSRC